MDSQRFDALIRATTPAPTRRGTLALLAGAALSAPSWFGQTEAKKGRHRNKQKHHRHEQRHHKNQNPPSPPTDAPSPPPPPASVITPDATCGQISDGTAPAAGDDRLAHTFTALGSGPLVCADLLLAKGAGSNGDHLLRLSPVDDSGVPTNTVLAETSVANANVLIGESTVSFSFAAPFTIVSGTQYALILARPGGDSIAWRFKGGNPCEGRSFVSQSQTDKFVPDSDDFIFATFVSS